MLKAFLFTDEQMDEIYEFIYIAQDVAETREEKDRLQKILKTIDSQTNYGYKTIKEFAIRTPGYDGTDFVYAETEKEAIIQWADEVGLTATQVETRDSQSSVY